MTWVIAQPTVFGYGVVISDIQVTLSDGTTLDCLQKIHKVADNVVIGFAGSVVIGFRQVSGLHRFLNSPTPPKGQAWLPEWVVEKWSPFAKAIFSQSLDGDKSNGCSLIVAAPHPTENVGIDDWARTYVYELHSPDFIPVRVTDRPASIGSGNGIIEYTKALKEATSDFGLMKMETGFPGGYGASIGFVISDILREHPVPGISKYFHLATLWRGRMVMSPYNYKITAGGNTEAIVMPPVAQTYEALVAIVGSHKAASAIAERTATI